MGAQPPALAMIAPSLWLQYGVFYSKIKGKNSAVSWEPISGFLLFCRRSFGGNGSFNVNLTRFGTFMCGETQRFTREILLLLSLTHKNCLYIRQVGYMGKNTPARKDFICQNLIYEVA
jgi:hypothetical protein